MADYGYSIEHILMVDIIPDAAVRKAMNDINAGIIPFLYMWESPPRYRACEMFYWTLQCSYQVQTFWSFYAISVDMLPYFLSSK